MAQPLAPSTPVTQRDDKGRKFMEIVGQAYDKAKLTEGEAQCVNDTPGLAALIRYFIAENRVPNKYKNEETSSSYTYPPTYKGPHPIKEQIKAVAEIYSLDPTQALEYAKALPALPNGAEGWFAFPSDEAIQNLFPDITNTAERYCAMLRLIHEKIAASRKFCNYREGEIDTAYLRQLEHTALMLAKVAETQPGDILIIAAQLGMRHRGRSVRRARVCFTSNEFGLCPVAVGTIVLTHPERFTNAGELDTDCAGGEWSWCADGVFGRAPRFCFGDDGVMFGAGSYGDSCQCFGAASGFLPQ
jgi:hypothetical protein